MTKIVYFIRKNNNTHSIELLFKSFKKYLHSDFELVNHYCKFTSKGLFRRIYNIFESYINQKDINHITGDIHYIALLLSKNKTLLTIHDLNSLYRLHGIKRKIYYLFWVYIPVKRVAHITVISEKTKNELLNYMQLSENKITVIKNCVSDKYTYHPKYFNYSKPVILQVGTKSNKNLHRVASALSGISCKLNIIGALSSEDLFVLKKNQINWFSRVNISESEMVKEYHRSDIVMFVSTYEGFGMPILEAQATGRPLITSNIEPMSNVSGKGAYLVDPFSEVEIRNAVLGLISDVDLRERLVKNGLDNVKKYHCRSVAKQYSEIYKKIIND